MKHCPKPAAAAASLALTVVASIAAAVPQTEQAPRSAGSRSHVAVAEFRMAEGTNARDLWMSVAFQEVIAWRLRRIKTLITVPTARLMQSQREIQSDEGRSTPLADIAPGFTHPVTRQTVTELLASVEGKEGVRLWGMLPPQPGGMETH